MIEKQAPAVGAHECIAFTTKTTGKQKLVRNEKGLWVKADAEEKASSSRGGGGGALGSVRRNEFGEVIGQRSNSLRESDSR
eukprot:765307-Hanusia_phi.AAC.9